jgi:hypothetical protein
VSRLPRTVAWLMPVAALIAAGGALAACDLLVEPTPIPTATAVPSPTPVASVAPTSSAAAASPTPTPEPALSLDPPGASDERRVRVGVAFALPADTNGRILVTLTNLSEERIGEVILRWPTELRQTIFLAPFIASEDRIRDGRPPLDQDWTKWVEGPGERGEPAGTTSLGYGPMDPGTTLTIPLFATRAAAGPVAFDLQVLVGEALLTRDDGTPAQLRVEAP